MSMSSRDTAVGAARKSCLCKSSRISDSEVKCASLDSTSPWFSVSSFFLDPPGKWRLCNRSFAVATALSTARRIAAAVPIPSGPWGVPRSTGGGVGHVSPHAEHSFVSAPQWSGPGGGKQRSFLRFSNLFLGTRLRFRLAPVRGEQLERARGRREEEKRDERGDARDREKARTHDEGGVLDGSRRSAGRCEEKLRLKR